MGEKHYHRRRWGKVAPFAIFALLIGILAPFAALGAPAGAEASPIDEEEWVAPVVILALVVTASVLAVVVVSITTRTARSKVKGGGELRSTVATAHFIMPDVTGGAWIARSDRRRPRAFTTVKPPRASTPMLC